jgi:hypothetical protein
MFWAAFDIFWWVRTEPGRGPKCQVKSAKVQIQKSKAGPDWLECGLKNMRLPWCH